jgi:multiple sugar transport system substrate-binding protein
MHIEYWVDMLEQAGFKETDIPKGWKDYWAFWCEKVQPAYRKASGSRAYGMASRSGSTRAMPITRS